MSSAFLRTYRSPVELVIYTLHIAAVEIGTLAVAIALVRTLAVEIEGIAGARHSELHSETEEVRLGGKASLVILETLAQTQDPIRMYGVLHHHPGRLIHDI